MRSSSSPTIVPAPPRRGPQLTHADLIETLQLRQVFGAFPTGVVALAARDGDRPLGIAASSFTSVSLSPPLVSVCVAHTSTTWPALRALPRLGVSVLGQDQHAHARRLAGPSAERFGDVEWSTNEAGAVFVCGASAWLETSVDAIVRAGDHDIVVLRVHDLGLDPAVEPLVFHASGFRSLLGQPVMS